MLHINLSLIKSVALCINLAWQMGGKTANLLGILLYSTKPEELFRL